MPHAFRSPSTDRTVRAVLFDTFGTVVDWRGGIAAAVTELFRRHGVDVDGAAFADAWRGMYRPSMAPVRDGMRDFVTLDVLHRESLWTTHGNLRPGQTATSFGDRPGGRSTSATRIIALAGDNGDRDGDCHAGGAPSRAAGQ